MLDAVMRKKPRSLLNCCECSPAEKRRVAGWQMPFLTGQLNDFCEPKANMQRACDTSQHMHTHIRGHTHKLKMTAPTLSASVMA